MATPRLLRPFPRALHRSNKVFQPFSHHTTSPARTFFASEPTTQHLSAARTLPYPTLAIYDIIADIDAYPSFLPLLSSAKVTSYSKPDAHLSRRWPQEATLTIGLESRGISESFVSKVYCVPPTTSPGRAGIGIVEAVSGGSVSALPALDPADIAHHDHADVAGGAAGSAANHADSSPLSLLKTRWTVRSYPYKGVPEDGSKPQEGSVEPRRPPPQEMTEVTLAIEYKFRNAMYEVLGNVLTNSVADRMVAAFEARVREVLGATKKRP